MTERDRHQVGNREGVDNHRDRIDVESIRPDNPAHHSRQRDIDKLLSKQAHQKWGLDFHRARLESEE